MAFTWLKCEGEDFRTRLGKRILLLGCPGSGKTTLGRQLSPILNLRLVRLDDHYWKSDGTYHQDKEWTQVQRSLCLEESWIIEGNYWSVMEAFELRIKRATTIIFLSTATQICVWRVLKRGVASLFSDHARSAIFRQERFCPSEFKPQFLRRVLAFNRQERALELACLERLGAQVLELKNDQAIGTLLLLVSGRRAALGSLKGREPRAKRSSLVDYFRIRHPEY